MSLLHVNAHSHKANGQDLYVSVIAKGTAACNDACPRLLGPHALCHSDRLQLAMQCSDLCGSELLNVRAFLPAYHDC